MSWPTTVSTATISTQGIILIATGLFALTKPEEFVKGTNDSIVGHPTQMVQSISLMGLTLGTSYLVVSSHRPAHRTMLLANIPLRILAVVLFWKNARNVAYYEGAWGVVNAAVAFFAF